MIQGGLTFLGALALAATVLAEDWPHFRGPDRNGISKETGWLFQWPDDGPKIAWKARTGLGYSSFVVAHGRAYTAGFGDGKDTLYCFDAATGDLAWKHSYPAELGDKYFQGGTTGTPTFEDGNLYWLSRWGDLLCLEAGTGKVVWSKNIHEETGLRFPDWGFTGAPYIHKNLLILNVGQAGVAVEKSTGKVVWKSKNEKAGYSTPLPLNLGGEPLVVIGSSEHYIAVHPETGAEAWRVRWNTQYGVNAADPIISGDKMFISTGYGKGAALFDLSQNPPRQLWSSKVLRTQLNAGVLFEGNVYGVDGDTTDRASLKCVEFATGKERWRQPNVGNGGLLIADGKIILLTGQGELMVLPASPVGFQPTARAQIFGGTSWTAPVLANGRVYCRNSRGDIVCVDLRKESVASN